MKRLRLTEEQFIGVHDENHRLPYAALAATMDQADRDHYAEKLRPKPVWADGGKQLARRIASGR